MKGVKMKYYLITYEYYQNGKYGKITTVKKGSIVEIVNSLKASNWLKLNCLIFAMEITKEDYTKGQK